LLQYNCYSIFVALIYVEDTKSFNKRKHNIMVGPEMFEKLEALKKIADESKAKLDAIIVEGESGGNLVVISLNGNREFKSIKINTDHKMISIEDLEDLISVAFQRAMEKVNRINEDEVKKSSQFLFPGM
jgi:DNA-binding protein YbaB